MWNPANNNDQTGQVAARMETTPSLGSASISISQQQAPKKFAPVVAPKPKFNPYKQIGEATHSDNAGNETGKHWSTDTEQFKMKPLFCHFEHRFDFLLYMSRS